MALPESGPLKFSDINIELGLSANQPIMLGSAAVRGLFGMTSGVVKLSNGYGRSNVIPLGLAASGSRGIFSPDATSDLYTFSNDTWAPTGTMPSGRSSYAAFSNTTTSYIANGISGSTTPNSSVFKYSYSARTFSTGTSLTRALYDTGAVSSGTFGIIGGGRTNSSSYANQTTDTHKYVHATDSVTITTTLTPARAGYSTFGTNTYGIFVAGYTTSNTAYTGQDKYTYSNDTITIMGALRATIRRYGGIIGNKQVVLDLGGILGTNFSVTVGTSDKYSHASESWSTGISTASPRGGMYAVGSSTLGVISFGTNPLGFGSSGVNVAEKYSYASESLASSTINSRTNLAITGTSNAANGLT